MELHRVPIAGRDIRDSQIVTETDLQQALIEMIPTPRGSHDEGGLLVRNLLAEFLRGFSLRTLIFLLDMVLPQLDAYHTGRQLQHLQPWVSVELAQQKRRGQTGTQLQAIYQYEAYAGFHVIQLHTDGAPVLLFSAPADVPEAMPRDLCAAGNLGSMEANVMAGRALLGVLQLPDSQRRCAIFLVHEKIMHGGTSKNPAQRAYRRIAPKSLELVVVSQPIARTFCGRLLDQQLKTVSYFDPARDWPKPIELNTAMPIVLEELAFLGDTRSHELLVFAQAYQSRLPLTMGILQPDIPVRRMANERKTKLNDALVRILSRFLTPGAHDLCCRNCLMPLAAHGDGHVLTVTMAMLLAILTGRSNPRKKM